jgi:diguanylate cyclase (GGDEF)-like protein
MAQDDAEMNDVFAALEAIHGSLAPREVLAAGLVHGCRLSGAPAGAIYLLSPLGELRREAAHGIAAYGHAAERRLNAEPLTSALRSGSVVPIPADLAPGLESGGHPTALLALPLRQGDDQAGVMELYLLEAMRVADRRRELLRELAAHITLSLRRAEAFRRHQDASLSDEVSGLPSRTYLDRRFRQEVARARRRSAPLACMTMALDAFKVVNDKFGHHVGDQLIGQVATRVRSAVPAGAVCAQYMGASFSVILPRTELAAALAIAEHLRAEVETGSYVHDFGATITVGVAATADADLQPALMQQAESALHTAKINHLNNLVRAAGAPGEGA